MLSLAKSIAKMASPFFLFIFVISTIGLGYRWSAKLSDAAVLIEILARALLNAFLLTAIWTAFLLLVVGLPIWLGRKKYDQ